jgi:peptidyl-prolyl cis-trans isomerase A (cyclophilin A)
MTTRRNPTFAIQTALGEVTLELYPSAAPITCANFLAYVEVGAYANSSFYRTVTPHNQPNNPVPISVIQGGLGMADHPLKRAPIAHETTAQTGLRHCDGAISMGRLAAGTANSEFFICIDDQPSLDYGGARNPDGQGFAAFGRVLTGMDIVRQIHQSPAEGEWLKPPIRIVRIMQLSP